MQTFWGILIPFLGTALGAACVFFMKKALSDAVQRSLTGFAAGVMVAASVWSLLIPAVEQSAGMGKLSFLPAFLGFWLGILFLLALDHIIPHLHANSAQAEGPKSRLQRTTMMVLAVTLHNIPEGMAVGVVYAGYRSGSKTEQIRQRRDNELCRQNRQHGADGLYHAGKHAAAEGSAFFHALRPQRH